MRTTLAILLTVLLGACTSARDTLPERGATEQLLLSKAVDRAVDRLPMVIPRNTSVFVDAANAEGYDVKYAIGAVRDRVIRMGSHLVAKREEADMVLEFRVGALSIDDNKMLVGIPSFEVPIPLTAGGLKSPEIALFKKREQLGIAKLAVTAYSEKKPGVALETVSSGSWGPETARSRKAEWTVMLFISWTDDDTAPENEGLLGRDRYF